MPSDSKESVKEVILPHKIILRKQAYWAPVVRFSRNTPGLDDGNGGEDGGNGGPNDQGGDDDDPADPIDSDEHQGQIPLSQFHGYPSPPPQNIQDTDDDSPMPGPSSAGAAGAAGGATNESPPRPSIPPTFREEDRPWRNKTEAAVIEVLQEYGRVGDILLMVREVRAFLAAAAIHGLAQHLNDSGSRLAVDDFIHRVLWDGYARRLWDKERDAWIPRK